MRWQKSLRWAIAAFVVVFAAIVVVSMRRGHPKAAGAADVRKLDPTAVLQTIGKGHYAQEKNGKADFAIDFGNQVSYEDGRSKFGGGVKVRIPDRNGRSVLIEAQEADVMVPPGKTISTGVFKGGVKMTTSDGITVQ